MTIDEAIKRYVDDAPFSDGILSAMFSVNQIVGSEPTADVKPIVHAHWIEGQTDNPNIHNILCSYCFEGFPSKGHANSQYTKERFQWCPSCGARMDEEVEI